MNVVVRQCSKRTFSYPYVQIHAYTLARSLAVRVYVCVGISLLLSRCLRLCFLLIYFSTLLHCNFCSTHTYRLSLHSVVELCLLSHCVYIGISHEGRWHTQFRIAADSLCHSADWMAGCPAIHTLPYSIHTGTLRIGKITSIQTRKNTYTKSPKSEQASKREGGERDRESAASKIFANKEHTYIYAYTYN